MRVSVVLSVLLVHSLGCSTATETTANSGAGTGEIRVISLTPTEGTAISESTVLRARLHYTLPSAPGKYYIMAQFATTVPGMTFDGSFPSSSYPTPTEPSGEVIFEFPMHYVIEESRLARPIEVWFFLNLRTAPGRGKPVAKAGPFRFV